MLYIIVNLVIMPLKYSVAEVFIKTSINSNLFIILFNKLFSFYIINLLIVVIILLLALTLPLKIFQPPKL